MIDFETFAGAPIRSIWQWASAHFAPVKGATGDVYEGAFGSFTFSHSELIVRWVHPKGTKYSRELTGEEGYEMFQLFAFGSSLS